MIALATIALSSLPVGGKVPEPFLGVYTVGMVSKATCDPVIALTLGAQQMRWYGSDLVIVMEETIDQNNIHLWLHDPAKKDDNITEYHLSRSPDGKNLLLGSDSASAASALKYGQPVADSGVVQFFMRCPAKFD